MSYLVTELLEGDSLRERLSAGALRVRKAVEIGVQIAQGLSAAHEKGIVHRDLKPANVFITKDGHAKVLDFGLAKLVAPRSAGEPAQASTVVEATEAGTTLGTVGYMSPEQVRGQTVDHRSDIFSFGCVLYEMLSGRAPFRRDTAADIASAILHEEPSGFSGTGKDIPPAIEGIVVRCLEKQPDERFQSARDLGFALQAEVEALTLPVVLRSARRPRRWLWAGTAALGVVAATAFALFLLTVRGHAGVPAGAGLIHSIAVLPLSNLSGDPGQEYFSDGMTEELIATLSKISALKVISRTSVMRFKGSTKPLREIAAALGVEGVVEGSVLRAGERVRITAQLINAATDTHLWAESYDRDLKDVLALQSDVARAVAGEVQAKLTPQEQTRLASTRPVNPEAYELYLKGRHLLFTFSEEEYEKGLDDFQRAIDLDPTWAPTYAAVGNFYVRGGIRGYQPPYETIQKAKPALKKALELDEGLAEAHAVLGLVLLQADWDWSGAERELRRAIALEPNRSDSHGVYATYLQLVGRTDEAVPEANRALELDPLTPYKGFGLATALYSAGRYDESIVQYRKALEGDPAGLGPISRMYLGLNYAQKHMYKEALAECDHAVGSRSEDQIVLGGCGWVSGLAGRRQQALTLLGRLEALSARHYVDPYVIAKVYDGLGDSDGAMEWLERSFAERSPFVPGIRSEYWTDRLLSDRCFQDLRRRMGYPAGSGR